MSPIETHPHDVLVVGAGGAGLSAAIAAAGSGLSVGLVCKSLLGKAHTVMAEGGIAAAMANLYPEDNWRVHFRDTMRGGKMLNHWRMAQLHAQEAPDRVRELEDWGALFDRTPDGLISQRDFGGHRYARLAHVGDRTGLELIRTLQQRTVALGIDVYMECTVTRLLTADQAEGGAITGAFGGGTYSAGAQDQSIVLQGVDIRASLSLGGSATDTQIIESLLQKNKLASTLRRQNSSVSPPRRKIRSKEKQRRQQKALVGAVVFGALRKRRKLRKSAKPAKRRKLKRLLTKNAWSKKRPTVSLRKLQSKRDLSKRKLTALLRKRRTSSKVMLRQPRRHQ